MIQPLQSDAGDSASTVRTFDLLAPHAVLNAVESAFGVRLDGTLTVYPSYVNRVYEVRDDDGNAYIAKFYRPGRWNLDAVIDEHRFVRDCAAAEVPVVAPIAGDDDQTVFSTSVHEEEREETYLFAMYPKRGGRSFDAERDDDWLRLGRLVGRTHSVASGRKARHRLVCTPGESTRTFIEELRRAGVVHPDHRDDFLDSAEGAVNLITPLFDGVSLNRIHGDCHRGNILDRPGEGLLLIDFDDMMVGPAVHDVWLLLPDRAYACRRELELLIGGYEEFLPFDRTTLRLIEPLRLMRMIYYLAWSARQREDHRFRESFPDWGNEAFWIKELEDLRTQLSVIREDLRDVP